jgi:hypothetical protein
MRLLSVESLADVFLPPKWTNNRGLLSAGSVTIDWVLKYRSAKNKGETEKLMKTIDVNSRYEKKKISVNNKQMTYV